MPRQRADAPRRRRLWCTRAPRARAPPPAAPAAPRTTPRAWLAPPGGGARGAAQRARGESESGKDVYMGLFERASCVEACKTRPSAATLPIGASHTSLKTCTSKLMTARADAPHPASAGVGGARPRWLYQGRARRQCACARRAAAPCPSARHAVARGGESPGMAGCAASLGRRSRVGGARGRLLSWCLYEYAPPLPPSRRLAAPGRGGEEACRQRGAVSAPRGASCRRFRAVVRRGA